MRFVTNWSEITTENNSSFKNNVNKEGWKSLNEKEETW